jgi:hypothetical protein
MQVRSLSTAGVNVKVIACGGDGTVMWVASILIGGGCNMSNVQIGVMPFGAQPSTAQHNTMLFTAQHSTAQHSTAQQGCYSIWDSVSQAVAAFRAAGQLSTCSPNHQRVPYSAFLTDSAACDPTNHTIPLTHWQQPRNPTYLLALTTQSHLLTY